MVLKEVQQLSPSFFLNENRQKSNTNLPCSLGFVTILLFDF